MIEIIKGTLLLIWRHFKRSINLYMLLSFPVWIFTLIFHIYIHAIELAETFVGRTMFAVVLFFFKNGICRFAKTRYGLRSKGMHVRLPGKLNIVGLFCIWNASIRCTYCATVQEFGEELSPRHHHSHQLLSSGEPRGSSFKFPFGLCFSFRCIIPNLSWQI